MLMTLVQRPETNFWRPPAPVKHCQWKTKVIDRLVVLLVEKNTLMALSGVPRKYAYTTDRTGCRQILFFMPEWATFVLQMPKTTQLLDARVLNHSQYLALQLRKFFSTKTLGED